MAATTQIRLASLAAATYGALLASGIVHHFQRTGSLRALVHGLAQPPVWIGLLVATLATVGLWRRQAWAWWLAVAAAGWQAGRILYFWFERGLARVPGVPTLLALGLLVLILVLLLPRAARLACNR
ncbi:MAG: hypothetical protein KGL68_04775 [Burkholderiales bacterium]|nr:hypothetical protein [Burkholderiales bacterium]